MNYKKLLLVVFGSMAISTMAYATERKATLFGNKFNITAQVSTGYNKIKGSLQTPKGGRPGSSDHRRPTFEELGISNFMSYSGNLTARYGRHEFFGGYDYMKATGESTLERSLTSQNILFSEGTKVSADVNLSMANVGYSYTVFEKRLHRKRLSISPGVDLKFWFFHYQLSQPDGPDVDRKYTHLTPRPGVSADYDFSEDLSMGISAYVSLPIADLQVNDFSLKGKYQITDHISLTSTLEWQLLDFEDSQTMPNHIETDIRSINLGLKFNF